VEVVHMIGMESSAQEAAALMLEKEVGCLVVSSSKGPIGMITEKDVLRKVTAIGANPGKVLVRDIMSLPLITVTADATVGAAAKKMIDSGIKRLVVLGEDGRFQGLITMTDIIRWMARQTELSDSVAEYLAYDVP